MKRLKKAVPGWLLLTALLAGPAVAADQGAAGGPASGGGAALHPPLKVLERFGITEYPLIAWCFHGPGGGGYDEDYVRAAKAAGFNVLIESQEMIKPANAVGGMKIMAVAFRFDRTRIEKQVINRFGADNPALLGFVLDDNCPRISGNSKAVATWLKNDHPRLVPFVSENQDTRNQIKTDIRILGTQNSRMKPGSAQAADGYCGRMEMDRSVANMYQMSFWPLWYGINNPGSIRFQTYAAIAYGAQGVICFAYTPNRPQWKPDGNVYKAHADMAAYVQGVIGRHVLGTRSAGVLHSSGMGPNAQRTNPWVARMDAGLLAGMLSTEAGFYAKDKDAAPTYVMVVRKEFAGWDEPPARAVRVDFAPAIAVVEVLERKTSTPADGIRVIQPAFSVPLNLLTGDGRLLVVNPDLSALGGLAGPYAEVCGSLGGLMAQVRGAAQPLTPAEFEKVVSIIDVKVRNLAAGASDAQGRDTVKRLQEAFEYLKKQGAARKAPDPGEQKK